MTERTPHSHHHGHAPHSEPRGLSASGLFHRVRVFLVSRWILFGCFILVSFLATVVSTLQKDGREILRSQRDAFVIEVFSRTGIPQETADLLQEKLRSLDGVRDVEAQSPEDSLKRLVGESRLDIDANWLSQKNEELKGNGAVLPWSFSVRLNRWDEAFLKSLVEQIEDLEIGYPSEKVVAEVHYDQDRWTLVYALHNYVEWLGKVLLACGLIFLSFLVSFVVRWLKLSHPHRRLFPMKDLWIVVALGVACGLISHLIYLTVLSVSFFPESFSWRAAFGRFLAQQIALCVVFLLLGYGYRAFERGREP